MNRPSRRVVLAGGAAALLGAGVAVPVALSRRGGGGKLVPELLASSPFYVAHRGGSADWPECSMRAYAQSVAAGVDALEIPLARSTDGVWFGLHDATLDRTSGTTGFVAAEHTWAEIGRYRITAAGTTAPGAAGEPYLRFEELTAAYAATHAIFVDPKVVDRAHHGELLALMAGAVRRPRDTFVAKGFCTSTDWGRSAGAGGYQTWGYYYGRDVDAGTTPFAATQADWTLLGLDLAASADTWHALLAYGKPVVGHVADDVTQARRLLADGARGVMLAGMRSVFGG